MRFSKRELNVYGAHHGACDDDEEEEALRLYAAEPEQQRDAREEAEAPDVQSREVAQEPLLPAVPDAPLQVAEEPLPQEALAAPQQVVVVPPLQVLPHQRKRAPKPQPGHPLHRQLIRR